MGRRHRCRCRHQHYFWARVLVFAAMLLLTWRLVLEACTWLQACREPALRDACEVGHGSASARRRERERIPQWMVRKVDMDKLDSSSRTRRYRSVDCSSYLAVGADGRFGILVVVVKGNCGLIIPFEHVYRVLFFFLSCGGRRKVWGKVWGGCKPSACVPGKTIPEEKRTRDPCSVEQGLIKKVSFLMKRRRTG